MYVCLYICMFVRVYVCVCMRVCNVCMYVCMFVCMHVCMCVRVYVCMYVCMYVCFYACMYVCSYVSMYVCMYVCMYAYIHLCRYNTVPVGNRGWQKLSMYERQQYIQLLLQNIFLHLQYADSVKRDPWTHMNKKRPTFLWTSAIILSCSCGTVVCNSNMQTVVKTPMHV